jgi:hypothetical protein
MSPPITGIFAPAGDKQAGRLFKHLERLQPGCAELFYVPENGTPAVSLERESLYWNDVDVSLLKSAYVRGFSYTNPVVPRAKDDADWSLWQYDYITEQQKTSFLYSTFSEMHLRGVKMSNAPGVYLDVSMKMDLMERLRSDNVAVTDLLCTNDRQQAEAFCKAREHALWRPVTGRAAWQLCLERQLDALVDTDKPPILLAGITEGSFVRCYICNGEPVLCLKFGPASQLPLERLEVFEVMPETGFYDQLRKTAKVVGMQWGAVHCVINDDEICVYDIDADPILTSLPTEVEEYLTLCLAHGLLEKSAPVSDALLDTALVRSLPFLRRMLAILFDMEGSKYRPQIQVESDLKE